jgi:gliding motility associated protien GldN
MKRLFVILIGFVFVALNYTSADAQVLGTVYNKNHTVNRKPVPYQYLREADVMWSKTIWRKVVLIEKLNHPLYYPTTPIGERMSLIDLLLWGIDNQGIMAWNPSNQFNEFANPMTREEINVNFGAQDKVIMVDLDLDGVAETQQVIPGSVKPYEVKEYILKELWFFDKQRSVMDVRVIGLCPIREYQKDPTVEDKTQVKLFWIYFPEVRSILANHEVFNPYNDSERRTFDDYFFKRMFSSFIIQESNSYDNRLISDYTQGIESLLEAERIKDKVFNYEHDLWEY